MIIVKYEEYDPKFATELLEKQKILLHGKQPISIFFDDWKDNTLVQIKQGNKFAKEVRQEEHITILQEPNSTYMAHTTPTSGSSENICSALIKLFQSIAVDTSNLCAIGCDGTVINTGAKNGVIARL